VVSDNTHAKVEEVTNRVRLTKNAVNSVAVMDHYDDWTWRMGQLFRAQANLTHRMLDPTQLTAVGIIINNGCVWKRYGKCIK